MIIIDGKKLREELLAEVKVEVTKLAFVPVFCDVLVGEDPVSLQYVRMKNKMAESVGIKFHNAVFLSSITTVELVKEIKVLNNIPNMCGIIIQLPLPKNLDTKKILASIDSKIDVDCLNGNFENSPTAKAIILILDSLKLDLYSKKIILLGSGPLVGQPVAKILEKRGLKFKIIGRDTENKEALIKEADIIISGAGDPSFIKGDMIKKGAVLIDAGTSESGAGIVGDVDLDSVKDVASFVSPVPGGVGPVTVAMLLKNVLQVAKSRPHP